MPIVLEAVDPEHPNLIAVVHGPLALFAVGEVPPQVRKEDLLAASRVASGSTDWQAKTETAPLRMRPFTVIRDEHYRLYLKVEG